MVAFVAAAFVAAACSGCARPDSNGTPGLGASEDTADLLTVTVSADVLSASPLWVLSDAPEWVLDLGSVSTRWRITEAIHLADGRFAVVAVDTVPRPAVFVVDSSARNQVLIAPPAESARVFFQLDHVALGRDLYVAGVWPGLARNNPRISWVFSVDRGKEDFGPLPATWGSVLGAFADSSLVVADEAQTVQRHDTSFSRVAILRAAPSVWTHTGDEPPDTIVHVHTRLSERGSYLIWTHEPLATIGVGHDRIWLAPDGDPEILAIGMGGDALMRIRWADGDRDVSAEAIRYWEEREATALAANGRPRQRVPDAGNRFASRYGAVASILIGGSGSVYVRLNSMGRYPAPSSSWLVFDAASGELRARLQAPPGVQIVAVAEGYVLVTGQDGSANGTLRKHLLLTK